MAESTSITEALVKLQNAQEELVKAREDLLKHNDDEDAHRALQERIRALETSENIYTNEEIKQIVKEDVKAHAEQQFQLAHPGWEEYSLQLTSTLSTLTDRITKLEAKDITGDDKTDLELTLNAIEEKYSIQLTSLQKAFKEAQERGQTELANSYKESIQKTLDSKNDEMMAAIEAWQTEHSSSSTEG